MNFRIIRVVILLGLAGLLAACQTFTPAIDTQSKAKPGTAYVYGRFKLQHADSFGRLRMGIELQGKQKGPAYIIQFEPSNDPSGIAVTPGTYSLTKLVFASANYEAEGEKLLSSDKLTKKFKVEAGKAYYIADFYASTSTGFRSHSWRLESFRDNFEETTTEMKSRYPNLKELEFVRALNLNQP